MDKLLDPTYFQKKIQSVLGQSPKCPKCNRFDHPVTSRNGCQALRYEKSKAVYLVGLTTKHSVYIETLSPEINKILISITLSEKF